MHGSYLVTSTRMPIPFHSQLQKKNKSFFSNQSLFQTLQHSVTTASSPFSASRGGEAQRRGLEFPERGWELESEEDKGKKRKIKEPGSLDSRII